MSVISPQRKAMGLYISACCTILCVAGIALSAFIAPYIVAYNFSVAAVTKNGDALATMIDFDELRENLRPQLRSIMAAHADEFVHKDQIWAKALASLLIDSAVDAFVTPSGLKTGLLELENARHQKKLNEWKIKNVSIKIPNITDLRSKKYLSNLAALKEVAGYESVDEFRVLCTVDRNAKMKLSFRREGLFGWKLTNASLADFAEQLYKNKLANAEHSPL